MLLSVWCKEEFNTCPQHVSNPSGYGTALTFVPKQELVQPSVVTASQMMTAGVGLLCEWYQ